MRRKGGGGGGIVRGDGARSLTNHDIIVIRGAHFGAHFDEMTRLLRAENALRYSEAHRPIPFSNRSTSSTTLSHVAIIGDTLPDFHRLQVAFCTPARRSTAATLKPMARMRDSIVVIWSMRGMQGIIAIVVGQGNQLLTGGGGVVS